MLGKSELLFSVGGQAGAMLWRDRPGSQKGVQSPCVDSAWPHCSAMVDGNWAEATKQPWNCAKEGPSVTLSMHGIPRGLLGTEERGCTPTGLWGLAILRAFYRASVAGLVSKCLLRR